MRNPNGDKRDLKGDNQRSGQTQKIDESTLSEKQLRIYKRNRSKDYMDEMDEILPDSLDEDDYDNEYGGYSRNKRKIEVFGRNIFNNKKLTFESDMNIPTPQDYRLGAGDAVYVDVWGASQERFEDTISPDGTINIQSYGPINLSGLTVAQANQRLRAPWVNAMVDRIFA